MRKLLFLLPLAVITAGCETEIVHKRIGPEVWWVCDSGEDEGKVSTCGANPEKGLARVCTERGRTIEDFEKLPDNALVVQCGDVVKHHLPAEKYHHSDEEKK